MRENKSIENNNLNTSESDIFSVINSRTVLSIEEFVKIKQEYKSFFSLYSQVRNKTWPTVTIQCEDEKQTVTLFLGVLDYSGFIIGYDVKDKEFILYMRLDPVGLTHCFSDSEKFKTGFCNKESYTKEIGRISSIKMAKKFIQGLDGPWRAENGYMLPLSISVYMQIKNCNPVNYKLWYFDNNERPLTVLEEENLNEVMDCLSSYSKHVKEDCL